jgi:hypothetical protein
MYLRCVCWRPPGGTCIGTPEIAQFTKSIKASEVVTEEICEVLHDVTLLIEKWYMVHFESEFN